MLDHVSRTVCRLACLYSFSLFFTAMALASVHVGGMRGALPCANGACKVLASTIEPAPGLPAIWPAHLTGPPVRM